MSEHERPVYPFTDIHHEDGKVRVTLAYDPKVDGMDAALYLDGSGSMADSYKYTKDAPAEVASAGGAAVATPAKSSTKKGGLLASIFGWASCAAIDGITKMTPAGKTNEVEPHARRFLEYLAGKDRNGRLRTCYWSDSVQTLGELTAADARTYRFAGPSHMGGTKLYPAIEDFLRYFKTQCKEGAERGMMMIMTDGRIEDERKVKEALAEVAEGIAGGRIKPINFLIVGVGSNVDEKQLERLSHEEYEGVGHLVCHRIAEEVSDLVEVASVLVNESMTFAQEGKLYDDKGNLIRQWTKGLPAAFEFDVPEGCTSIELEVNGKKYAQKLPDEEHDEDDSAE